MSRLIQLALAGSVLAGGGTTALAQKIDPLLQISAPCIDVQVVQNGIQNRVEYCFIKDGNGKVYHIKDGESIQIGPYLHTRTGWEIEKKYNPDGDSKASVDMKHPKISCLIKATTHEAKTQCLK